MDKFERKWLIFVTKKCFYLFIQILYYLISILAIYLYFYGCVVPPICRRRDPDYEKIQLERERRIGELWKHNNQQTDHLQRCGDHNESTILP